jgi:hypothetical protein
MTEQVFMQRAVALALEKMRTNSGGPFGRSHRKRVEQGVTHRDFALDPLASIMARRPWMSLSFP